MRNSHHNTGSVSRPISTSGSVNPSARSADHAGTVRWRSMRPMALSVIAAPMRACRAKSSSVAGRSVRWIVKLQPSRSVSFRFRRDDV